MAIKDEECIVSAKGTITRLVGESKVTEAINKGMMTARRTAQKTIAASLSSLDDQVDELEERINNIFENLYQVEVMGYARTGNRAKEIINQYATKPIASADNNTFYFILNRGIIDELDILVEVTVGSKRYGIQGGTSVGNSKGMKIFYFELNDGSHIDFVNGKPKSSNAAAAVDLSNFDGQVTMTVYKTDPQEKNVYPTGLKIMKKETIEIHNTPVTPIVTMTPAILNKGDTDVTFSLSANYNWAKEVSEEALGLDFGETGLSFSNVSAGKTAAIIAVKTTGTVGETGTVTITPTAAAFDPGETDPNYTDATPVTATVESKEEELFTAEAPISSMVVGRTLVSDLQDNIQLAENKITGYVKYAAFDQNQNSEVMSVNSGRMGNWLVLQIDENEKPGYHVGFQYRTDRAILAAIDMGNNIYVFPARNDATLTITQTRIGISKPDYQKTYSLSDLKIQGKPATKWDEVVTLAPQNQEKDINISAKVKDIQADDVTFTGEGFDVTISGTLHYFEWKGFDILDTPDHQKGHYLAMTIDRATSGDKIYYSDQPEDDDPEFLYAPAVTTFVENTDQKLYLKITHDARDYNVTISFSGLTLEENDQE